MVEANDQPGKPVILAVDDTPDNLALISGVLKELYQVKVATNGKDALQIAFSANPPDLILLDVMMPGMDGFEVCRELKSDSQTRDIPVIFITAMTAVVDEKKGFELGAVDYITKPIRTPILLARVRTHLRLKRVTDFLKGKLEDIDERKVLRP
jgi:putative two-component system response regulator